MKKIELFDMDAVSAELIGMDFKQAIEEVFDSFADKINEVIEAYNEQYGS